MTICRISRFLVALLLLATTRAYAGEMGAPGLMPHELVASLVGLAAILLFTILSLGWLVWRLRGLDRRLRELEESRKL